jgi:sporulation protein YlmC with PRC-barrel domain
MSDERPTGRELDLDLHLLDRQVIDHDGKLVCKVDDIEFERGTDGSLYVAAILVGPRALGRRIGSRLGRWFCSIAERLSTDEMPRIDYALVSDIGSAITLSTSRATLRSAPLEDWIRQYVIERIPGSHHAGE